MSEPAPPAPPPKPTSSSGSSLGTLALGAVLVGGAFYGLQTWQKKQAPLPPPEPPAPTTPATNLSKPDASPGGPPKPAPAAPTGDSLSMVKAGADMKEPETRGELANGFPEPPLKYSGDGGPERLQTRVFKYRRDWDQMWKDLGGHDLPLVDFEKYMGVAVFAGTRPAGTAVEVAAKPEGGRLVVRWRLVPPGQPQPGTTRPYAAILVPRTKLPAVFREAK